MQTMLLELAMYSMTFCQKENCNYKYRLQRLLVRTQQHVLAINVKISQQRTVMQFVYAMRCDWYVGLWAGYTTFAIFHIVLAQYYIVNSIPTCLSNNDVTVIIWCRHRISSNDDVEATVRLQLRLAVENSDVHAAMTAVKEFRKLGLDDVDGDLIRAERLIGLNQCKQGLSSVEISSKYSGYFSTFTTTF